MLEVFLFNASLSYIVPEGTIVTIVAISAIRNYAKLL